MGSIFGTRSVQEGAKMSPGGPLRASKTQKAAFAKTCTKKHCFFKFFGVQRLPKRASGGPRGLPRGTQGAPKLQKKGIQKWTPKLTTFGPILGLFWGPFWDPKLLQKGTKTWTTFGTPLPRLSEVGEKRFREINESGKSPINPRIIFSKRKGGIRPLKAF